MITENKRLAMDYRDAGLWKNDYPTSYGNVDNEKCSKCGESVKNASTIDVNIPGAHGIEHYEFHKQCVVNALNNASIEFDKIKPVKIPF